MIAPQVSRIDTWGALSLSFGAVWGCCGGLLLFRGQVLLLGGGGLTWAVVGFSGGLAGFFGGLPLGLVQRFFDEAQHELPLGVLLAGPLAFPLQVGLDPMEEGFGDLEGHRSSIVARHDLVKRPLSQRPL